MKAEGLAAAQEIKQVLGVERLVINEDADGIEVHGLDAEQVTLDDFWIVSAAPQPVLEVLVIGQADSAGGHVVHAMGLPGLAIEPEAAVAGFDELGFGFGAPHAERLVQDINENHVLE